jgi:hypothetical protein
MARDIAEAIVSKLGEGDAIIPSSVVPLVVHTRADSKWHRCTYHFATTYSGLLVARLHCSAFSGRPASTTVDGPVFDPLQQPARRAMALTAVCKAGEVVRSLLPLPRYGGARQTATVELCVSVSGVSCSGGRFEVRVDQGMEEQVAARGLGGVEDALLQMIQFVQTLRPDVCWPVGPDGGHAEG